MYKRESGNWLKHGDFIILDILCIQIALLVAYMFRNGFEFPWKNDTYQQMAFILTIMDIVVVFFMQSYKGILRRGYFQEFKETLLHVSATITGFILFNFITKSGQQYSRMVVVLMWEIAIILCYMIRVWRKKVLKSRAALTQKGKKALVILSDYAMAETFAGRISKNNYTDRKLAGIIVTDRDLTGQTIKGIPVVADRKNAVNYLCQNWVDEVITCYNNNEDVINPILEDCREMGITVHIALTKCGIEGAKRRIENVGGYTVVTNYITSASNRQIFLKRLMDICGGIVGCIITLILFLFVAPAIYIKSPGPIFFSQIRVGKNGKKFRIYKFRSMYMDAEERKKELMAQNEMQGLMFKMKDDPRITKVGKFIRKTSIDELPQFINVLKGDMSLVGTRPPTVNEFKQYQGHHKRRLSMKPGITGMWQAYGRSTVKDFEQIVKMDLDYIDHWSLGLDMKILCRTVVAVFQGG